MPRKARAHTDHDTNELNGAEDPSDMDQVWADFDENEGDLTTIDVDQEAPKARKRKATTKSAPKAPPKMPTEPPFHILRLTPNTSGKGSRYMVIDTWTKKVAPTPIQLRDSYGPGSFQVQDAQGNTKKWAVAAFNKTENDVLPEETSEETEPQPPPPFRVAPDPPPSGPLYSHAPQHAQSYAPQMHHNPHAAEQWGQPHRQTYQQPPIASAAPSQPDPQLLGTFYRLDAAIQQISADCRRLQDELRSVTYELQQVPNRVAERVTSAISDAVDPFDQMSKVWEMSRNIADGYGPGQKEESGGGMAEMIQAAVGALAARAQPPQVMPQEAPQLMQAPPVATPQQTAPAAPQPPTNAASAELAGMTPELKAELEIEAAKRGISWDDAINLAKRYNWDAPQLLMAARATGAPQSGPSA